MPNRLPDNAPSGSSPGPSKEVKQPQSALRRLYTLERATRSEMSTQGESWDHRSMKILLVEDSPVFQHVLGGYLREWRFDFQLARDGMEAWDLLGMPDAPHWLCWTGSCPA